MTTRIFAAGAIAVSLMPSAQAQRSSRYDVVDESTVTRTLTFPGGTTRSLDVRNINGFIHVEGTNDSTVQMSIRQVIRAETQEDLAEARKDVRLEFVDGAPRVEAVVTDRRGRMCGEPWHGGDQRWDHVHYSVRFDFTIRVPRDTRLRLCAINGGDVVVTGTQGDFDVSNVNGPIDMRQVAGSGRAHTVNGPVSVTFTVNPQQDTSFKSVNGNVDVSFLDGLSADFSMKTFNGGLYTDFDAQALPGSVSAAGERRNGRFVYRANEFTRVRVGGGGPQITFETLNGNVRARRAEGRAR